MTCMAQEWQKGLRYFSNFLGVLKEARSSRKHEPACFHAYILQNSLLRLRALLRAGATGRLDHSSCSKERA